MLPAVPAILISPLAGFELEDAGGRVSLAMLAGTVTSVAPGDVNGVDDGRCDVEVVKSTTWCVQ